MIGIYPFWILTAIVLAVFTDIPPEIVLAGSAAGLAISVVFVTQSAQAKSSLLALLTILAVRFVLAQMIPAKGMMPEESYDWVLHLLMSKALLIICSLLSLVVSTAVAYSWIFHGPSGGHEKVQGPKVTND